MSFYVPPQNSTPSIPAYQQVQNFFSNLFTPKPATPAVNANFQPVQNNATFGVDLPSAYQVKPTDNDLFQVANNLGVPPQQLIEANDGAKTLPPIGSYMAVDPAKASATRGADIYQTPPVRPGFGAGNPNSYYQGAGTGTAGAPQLPNLQQAQSMLQQGIDPPVIHSGLVTALNLTHDQMIASGYTLDAASKTYKKAGTGAQPPEQQQQQQQRTQQQQIQTGIVPSGQQFQRVKASENYGAFVAQEQAFLNAQRWDPERKKYVPIRQLLNEGKLNINDPNARFRYGQMGGGSAAPAPRPITNTPAQQLALMLGSG